MLARAIWAEFPQYRSYFGITAIRSGKRVLRTYNPLLERYRGATGMKTGFICNSGFNLVATATRERRSMLVVVLGAHSASERAEAAAQLLDKGFRSWGGVGRVGLDAYRGTAESVEPVNLRPEVCERRKRNQTEEVAEGSAPLAPSSSLGPRMKIMEPVRVVTGVSKPAGATPAKAVGVPLPRPRPADSELQVQAYSPHQNAPSVDAIGEAIRIAPATTP